MFDQTRLLELIRNGENSFVEFKDDAVANEKLAREIAAFANHRGGFLLLGVNDAGEITARDELQRLFRASANIHYEISPIAGARVADLDISAFAEFMLNFRNLDVSPFDEPSQHRLLENLNLAVATEAGLQPTLAGLLLFGKNKVGKWLPQNGIDCVKIRGTQISDEIDDTKFFGRHALANLEDAFAFIYRYNTQSFVIDGMRRIDTFDYPAKALRESLVNALVHRDYIIAGSRIRVHVFENRLEIRSPGGIPNSLSLEKIKLGFCSSQLKLTCYGARYVDSSIHPFYPQW